MLCDVRFLIFGAGAVGGVIGGRLAQAGHPVVLIARGAHLQAIRRDGLLFETPDASERLRLPAVAHPSEHVFDSEDVVLLTVKSQDSAAALDALRDSAGADVPVVCAQNGVANEPMAARRFAQVYGMLVFLPANHLEPGVVQAQSRRTTGVLDLGRWPRGVDERARRIADVLERARCSARPVDDIMPWKRAKLLGNLANALQACCASHREGVDLLKRARGEAEACFRAAGLDWVPDDEFAARRGDWIEPAPIHGRMRGGGSSWQSLARGTRSIESDWLNGEIVLLGRRYGVPTPVNRALQEASWRLARQGAAPGSLPLDALRARVTELAASD